MENKEKTLIIGAGEIGTSLGNVLSSYYEVVYDDIKYGKHSEEKFEVINICFPSSDKFIEITKNYIKKYQPKLTIIHSTVPVGTTRKFGDGVVHSPVNGKHPHLEEGIKTFIKFIGAIRGQDAYEAEKFLSKTGIRISLFSSPEATELAKILCTTRYGWYLLEMKETERLCKDYNVPFQEIYTLWNMNYNNGYRKLAQEQFFRPIYAPMRGEIGGHCVIKNTFLLDSFLTNTVKSRNDCYKEDKNEDKNLVQRKISNSDRKNRRRM